MTLKKIIPVEEDDLKKAYEKAQEIFIDNELSSEYLNSRHFRLGENQLLKNVPMFSALYLYDKYGDDVTYENIKEIVDEEYSGEIVDYLIPEIVKALEKNHNVCVKKIKI